MKRYIFVTIIFVFSACMRLSAQNVEFEKQNFPDKKDQLKEANSNIKEGDKLYFVEEVPNYRGAIEFYLKANDFNPNNARLNYKIGKCYLNSATKTRAIKYLEKAYSLDGRVVAAEKGTGVPDVLFLLAESYQYNMEWDKAIKTYKDYLATLSPVNLTAASTEVNKKIDECNNGKEFTQKKVRVFIDNIGNSVNTAAAEYGPVISADESVMMFTSKRNTTTGGGIDPNYGDYYEDIYISNNNGGRWSVPTNPGKPLNTDGHDATVGLSNDGQKLLIYKGDKGGDIYQCEIKGDVWGKPYMLDKTVNSQFKETSASLSPDQRTLYFVSNKDGGYGGGDIYISKWDSKKERWMEATNLGPVINSPYDEEAVFIHPDGKTLYFSSRGHKTMGGFDIFKSVNEGGKWSEPENLGFPINGPEHDVYFVLSANGKHGYYSSVKDGGYGSQDIYMITFLGPEKPTINNNEDNLMASQANPISEVVIEPTVAVKTNPLTILKGVIFDDASKQPLYAKIELTDNVKNELLATFESNSKTGKYLVSLPSGKNYGIAVKADGYLFYSGNVDIQRSEVYQEIVKDIGMKKVEVGSKVVLNNIFFEFAKATLTAESYAELGILYKLLTDNPSLKVEISGHTDNKGSADYNQKLSESRAKSVVDWLITKGIKENRMTFKGYGMLQPIATNDTDEGRRQNRRTEFKIVGK